MLAFWLKQHLGTVLTPPTFSKVVRCLAFAVLRGLRWAAATCAGALTSLLELLLCSSTVPFVEERVGKLLPRWRLLSCESSSAPWWLKTIKP